MTIVNTEAGVRPAWPEISPGLFGRKKRAAAFMSCRSLYLVCLPVFRELLEKGPDLPIRRDDLLPELPGGQAEHAGPECL